MSAVNTSWHAMQYRCIAACSSRLATLLAVREGPKSSSEGVDRVGIGITRAREEKTAGQFVDFNPPSDASGAVGIVVAALL